MPDRQKFIALFGVPEFVIPHLIFFLAGEEIDLVVKLNGQKCTPAEVADRLGSSLEPALELLESCYAKNIVNREEVNGQVLYFSADFYDRLDFQCKFDPGYKNLDKELLSALDNWCYEVYKGRMNHYLEQLQRGEPVFRAPETFELLENIEEFLDSSHEIRLVPCNCRSLADNCAGPLETCLSFDQSINDRTFGTSLTKEEALQVVKRAHKSGLMHQVNSDWRTKGPAWLCNCCSCCCYPTRLAREKGSKGVFPVLQYVARVDGEKCVHCGACVRRCHFSAFHLGKSKISVNGKLRARVEFEPEKCWGCGICADSCSLQAITIVLQN